MLAAVSRLRRRDEFVAATRGGSRAARGCLVVHLTLPPAPSRDGSAAVRVGFVVPKAVGGAVVRNKVRRRLRHLMRDRLAGLPGGSAVVVRALAGAADHEYAQLAADLDGALAAAGHGSPRRSAGYR